MAIPKLFENRLSLPVVCAPMFLVSGPELVIEACKSGVVGTFPALNRRTSEDFEAWLVEIKQALKDFEQDTGKSAAPFGVNLIVHKSNPRLQQDLELCVKHEVPLIITSLGAVQSVIDAVHSYSGLVFHDVINIRHAKKAAGAGVDGLIAVCAGAGGHAGTMSPFALVSEIRKFYDKTILLAGCLSHGKDIAAAQVMGADMAYLGTRFICTKESMAVAGHKQMIMDHAAIDISYTDKVSGINANFLTPSLLAAKVADDEKVEVDVAKEMTVTDEAKAWKDVWSAGQGVGSIDSSPPVAELVADLAEEYKRACDSLKAIS